MGLGMMRLGMMWVYKDLTALEPRSFQIESIGAVSKVAQATSYIIDQEGHVLWSSGDQAPRLERTHI